MRTLSRDLKRTICLFSAVLLIAGCGSLGASVSRQPEDSLEAAARAEAQMVISILNSQNHGLKNFKGLGKITVRQNQATRVDERIAWIASETAKLNIAVLVGGHPAIKMASDGKWFYYYEAREGRPFYKKVPASDANLKRVITIPIKTSDIIALLAGRVPLREHHSAILESAASGQGYVLVLKRRWWGVTEKIYLDETKSRVHQTEFYNRSGSLVYLARFDEMQTVKGYRVPALVSITDGDGIELKLVIYRYWADVDVSESMFVLNPPKK
ncbi:MAG: DUF4292 domain-containing protein [Desulfobacterales bacterium]